MILPTAEFDCPIVDFQAWWNTTFGNTDYLKEDKNETEKAEFFNRLQTFAIAENKLDFIGFIGGKLRYFGTAFRLTANPLAPAVEKKPLEDRLDEMTKELNANAPSTAKNARVASEEFRSECGGTIPVGNDCQRAWDHLSFGVLGLTLRYEQLHSSSLRMPQYCVHCYMCSRSGLRPSRLGN